ncbi:helix-turn-helix transcriptional regulator [Nonomuraea sp. NPDC003804]|uniref:helix-turn-helix transcriptional regulator n=1 Tax=Nonomuraea sp. NPDC003804 TaxID=3154547 RepID=UPI0033AF1257
MDGFELAEFLKGRRAHVLPEDVGLPAGTRRRTPGLRREEVARLAGISVDYYMRLEQARGSSPSQQVLGALARALRLAEEERTYLYHLAGKEPPPPEAPPQDVPQDVLLLLSRLEDNPAYVMDAKWDVLAWNNLATRLITDFPRLPPRDRNFIRWACRTRLPLREGGLYALLREGVADLRAASARYPLDVGVKELVSEVNAVPEFAAMWAKREIVRDRRIRRVISHPILGGLELYRDVLFVPHRDQRVVLYTATCGSPSYEALRRLKPPQAPYGSDQMKVNARNEPSVSRDVNPLSTSFGSVRFG